MSSDAPGQPMAAGARHTGSRPDHRPASAPRTKAQPKTASQEVAQRPVVVGERAWQVSDDLPRPTPVGRAEVEALEVYLGAQLDDILRRMRG